MSRRVFTLAASLAALGLAAGVFPPPTEAPGAPIPGATVDWPHFRFDNGQN